MIDRDHKLPLARQAKAVGISRGSIYYRPRPVGEAGLGLMRRIDELHLEYPFAGSRMMRGLLRQEGLSSGRRHIATLMRMKVLHAKIGELALENDFLEAALTKAGLPGARR